MRHTFQELDTPHLTGVSIQVELNWCYPPLDRVLLAIIHHSDSTLPNSDTSRLPDNAPLLERCFTNDLRHASAARTFAASIASSQHVQMDKPRGHLQIDYVSPLSNIHTDRWRVLLRQHGQRRASTASTRQTSSVALVNRYRRGAGHASSEGTQD